MDLRGRARPGRARARDLLFTFYWLFDYCVEDELSLAGLFLRSPAAEETDRATHHVLQSLADISIELFDVLDVQPGQGMWVREWEGGKEDYLINDHPALLGIAPFSVVGMRVVPTLGDTWSMVGEFYPFAPADRVLLEDRLKRAKWPWEVAPLLFHAFVETQVHRRVRSISPEGDECQPQSCCWQLGDRDAAGAAGAAGAAREPAEKAARALLSLPSLFEDLTDGTGREAGRWRLRWREVVGQNADGDVSRTLGMVAIRDGVLAVGVESARRLRTACRMIEKLLGPLLLRRLDEEQEQEQEQELLKGQVDEILREGSTPGLGGTARQAAEEGLLTDALVAGLMADLWPPPRPDPPQEVSDQAFAAITEGQREGHVLTGFFDYHYRRWPDKPLGVLDQLTLREAARLLDMRPAAVEVLKQTEYVAFHTQKARSRDLHRELREAFRELWNDVGLLRPDLMAVTSA